MTDLTRRLAQALPVPHPFSSGHAVDVQAPPLSAELSLPRTVPAKARDALASSIEAGVRRLARQLGAPGDVEIETRDADPGAGDAAGLSIDGRPAAVFRCDGPALEKGSVDAVADTAILRLLGRLPLLLGPLSEDTIGAYVTELGLQCDEILRDLARDVDMAETFVDLDDERPIVVEVSAQTLRRVDDSGASAVAELRRTEFRMHGTHLPDVRLEHTDEPAGFVRLKLNDVSLPARNLGEDAGWNDVVEYLRAETSRRRHWFLRVADVSSSINADLQYLFPDLVRVTEANYSAPLITACLRELVRGGGPVRNLPRILWLLLEQGASRPGPDALRLAESPLVPKALSRNEAERNPAVLAARVRKIAIEEAWRLGRYVAPETPVRLPDELEIRLLKAAGTPDLGAAEWTALRAIESMPDARTVITHRAEAIAPVRSALQALAHPPRVVTSHELPPDADLTAIPTAKPPRPARDRRHVRGSRK